MTDDKNDKEMNSFEKAAIIGYHRSGATNEEIGYIMGISSFYAKQIIKEYLQTNSSELPNQ